MPRFRDKFVPRFTIVADPSTIIRMTLRLVIAVAAMIAFVRPFTVSCSAQGQVVFNNRVPPDINARVLCPDGVSGLDSTFSAQLFAGPVGTSTGLLTPLFPITPFRSGAAAGYVVPVDVTVPGIPPGAQATIVMRAFFGPSFTNSPVKMEGAPFTVTLGGGLLPPANLIGLQGFTTPGGPNLCIPEPATNAIIAAGLLWLGLTVGLTKLCCITARP